MLRRAQKRHKTILSLLSILIVIIIAAAVFYYFWQKGTKGFSVGIKGELYPIDNQVVVLVMGMDAIEPNRTDTIMLASLNSTTGHLGVISIPRDTRVMIPGRGFQRINVVHALGGPEGSISVVEELLGVDIDYWVKINYQGFMKIVDTIGGVEITIPTPMEYTDTKQNLYINLQPGTWNLNGDEALQYVRYRDGLGDVALADPNNEIYKGRVVRQLNFVQALAKQIMKPTNISKAPTLISQLINAVETNIPIDKALSLLGGISRIDLQRMETEVLPGTTDIINGASYWVSNPAKTKEAVNKVLLGREEMISVAVLNGNGVKGAASQMADFLRLQGYLVLSIGNADNYNYKDTLVFTKNLENQELQRVLQLLNAKKGEEGELKDSGILSQADFVVIVGDGISI